MTPRAPAAGSRRTVASPSPPAPPTTTAELPLICIAVSLLEIPTLEQREYYSHTVTGSKLGYRDRSFGLGRRMSAQNNDVLVVIGAGGMGVSIARRVGAGRTIVLADINAAGLDATASALIDDGHQVLTQQVDVT